MKLKKLFEKGLKNNGLESSRKEQIDVLKRAFKIDHSNVSFKISSETE